MVYFNLTLVAVLPLVLKRHRVLSGCCLVVNDMELTILVDPDIINDDDIVEASREQQAQAQQAQMKMAAMAQGAMIAKDAGSAAAGFAKSKPQETK